MTQAHPETEWVLQYSPETFCMAELEVSLQVCNAAIAATIAALNLPIRIDSYEERSLGSGAEASALAIVEVSCLGVPGSKFGAGQDANIVKASVLAVLNAALRFSQIAN